MIFFAAWPWLVLNFWARCLHQPACGIPEKPRALVLPFRPAPAARGSSNTKTATEKA